LFIADVQEDLNQFLAETEAHERRSRGQNASAPVPPKGTNWSSCIRIIDPVIRISAYNLSLDLFPFNER